MATILRPRQPWTIHPPDGWEPVAEICRDVYDDLDHIVEQIARVFTEEIPAFQDPEVGLTREGMRWSGRGNIAGFLAGLAERRPLQPEELEFRRYVGERTCAVGFPLKPLVDSFHISYRELWSILVARAEARGGDAPKLLLSAGASVWERMHATIDAITEGYERESLRREADEMRLTAELFDAIDRDPAGARVLAERMGFSPDGVFVAIAVLAPTSVMRVARRIIDQFAPHRATAAQEGPVAFVLVQVGDRSTLEGALRDLGEDVRLGLSTIATGLEDGARCIEEARLSLDLARARGSDANFEDDWLDVLAFTHRSSLQALLAPGIDAASTQPHLVAAVRAYAAAGHSVAEGARCLRLSENSFRHRLTRWHALTGWDPRTHDGMTRSLTAIGFSQR